MKKLFISILISLCAIVFCACNGELTYKTNLSTYNINVCVDSDNMTLNCTQTTNYVNSTDNVLKNIKFHLYPNAFRENAQAKVVSLSNEPKAYPNGKSYGNIQIESVKNENNTDFEYTVCGQDENILDITLQNELYPNDKVNICFEYSVKLPNINHRFGYGENTINICNFYPIACVYENGEFACDLYNFNGDPFYSQVANYNVVVEYDSSYTLASTGNQTKTNLQNERAKTFVSANCVRDFALVLSNKFVKQQQKYDENTSINYYYYDDENHDESMLLIQKVLTFFEDKIGEYPYNQISVAKANFVHGGMEFPNLVLISDELDSYETYEMVIIHELVHQWFYSVVGNNQYKYGWIDEGLTEFCTAYFYDNHSEYNRTLDQMVKSSTNSYLTFAKVYKDVNGTVDTSMNRALNEFNTEPEYVYNTYTKGMLMFASVYEVVGEKSFVKALKYYYHSNAYKEVIPEELVRCFCKGSGKNLTNLFDSWLDGKVLIVGL